MDRNPVSRGGPRVGAGRPKTGQTPRRQVTVWLTTTDEQEIKDILQIGESLHGFMHEAVMILARQRKRIEEDDS